MAIGDIIVGVDIGTSKVCTVVGEVNNFGQIEIISNTSYKCSGLKKGKIIDEEEICLCVAKTIKDAEDETSSDGSKSDGSAATSGFEFSKEDTLRLCLDIVPYFLKHNGEEDAVDLLLEIESIDKLPQFVDENTFQRVCQYMVACVPLLPPPENNGFWK